MTGIEVNSLSKNNKAYQCLICQNIFSKKNLYQNHLRLHGKESGNPYHCDICGKSFAVPARLTRHYRTHTGEKPFQCEYCSKSFSVKENLSVHRRIHTKERPYKCNICESAFEHSGKLHRHMRIHTGERPHKCSLCTKTFIQSGQLVIHMRTHTGEKPYICKSCGKGFTCSKQLKVHTRTHTGEKPYKCEICSKTFGYNHVLKLHQVAHYGEKLYKCTLCQETFTSKKLMELHIKNHSDSSICNLSKPTQLFYETTKNVNKMILCNKNNNTTDNKMFIIKAVNEKTISKISEAIKNAEKYVGNATNLSLYRSSKEKFNQIENITRSSLNADKPNVIKNTNSRCCFTNNDLTNANSQVTKDKEFLSDNYLLTSRLSSNNKSHIEQYVNLYDLPRQQSLKKLKGDKYVTTYYNSESTHNYLISERNSIVSLPPRKRSKMILESMKEENFEILPTRRFNSVIKFATSDNMNFEIH